MIKIGWASRNVSTDSPVDIPGQFYRRISKKCMDEITVTALIVEREDTVIMVSGDFASAGNDIIVDIRNAVKSKNSSIPTENILYSATHTHSSPRFVTSNLAYDNDPCETEVEPPQIYRAFLVDNISDAIVEAYEKREEGSFAYGYETASIGVSRRVTYFNDRGLINGNKRSSLAPNGHGVMYGKTNDEMFVGYEGTTDSNVNFMFTFDKNDQLTGAVINVPCPSQCGENELYLSSDYWHFARKFIREKYGNIYILPQCAAAGDLSPHTLHQKAAENRMLKLKYSDNIEHSSIADISIYPMDYYYKVELGERIAEAFSRAYPWATKEKIKDAPVFHNVEFMPLEAWKISDEQYKEAKEGLAELKSSAKDEVNIFGNSIKASAIRRYENVIRKYEKGEDFVPTEVHTIRIGDIAFASNPFELYIDYQHRIQGRSPFTQTFIVQLSAAAGLDGSYLCTERAKENMGYSAIIYSCRVSPEGGQTLVNKTVNSLNELKNKG